MLRGALTPGANLRMGRSDYLDCTRLTEPQRLALLAALDRYQPMRADSRRREVRYEYHAARLPVTVHTGGPADMGLLMHGRNISRGGVSLLHGGFMHSGTPCTVVLSAVNGTTHMVTGLVVGCRHISRNIHEVCVRFHEKISIEAICGPHARVCSLLAGAPDTPRLKGLAMCLARGDAARREIAGWLTAAGLDAVEARTFGTMMDKVKRLPFVVAVVDEADAEWKRGDAARSARTLGFGGGIIVIDPGIDDPTGADAVVHRPLDPRTFYAALSRVVLERTGDEGRPIHSTLRGDAADRALLERFVESAHGAAAGLEVSLTKRDRKPIITSLGSLRSTAGGYGFGVLGQAAAAALGVLERGDVSQAERSINLVISLCRRLSAEAPPSIAA